MCGAVENGVAAHSAAPRCMARHWWSWDPCCQRGSSAVPSIMAWHNSLQRHADWRGKKRLVQWNIFGGSLLFKFITSLSYFCLNCPLEQHKVIRIVRHVSVIVFHMNFWRTPFHKNCFYRACYVHWIWNHTNFLHELFYAISLKKILGPTLWKICIVSIKRTMANTQFYRKNLLIFLLPNQTTYITNFSFLNSC
jgi:hypothetical protein